MMCALHYRVNVCTELYCMMCALHYRVNVCTVLYYMMCALFVAYTSTDTCTFIHTMCVHVVCG